VLPLGGSAGVNNGVVAAVSAAVTNSAREDTRLYTFIRAALAFRSRD
jgi:hypothetical protein